MWKRFLSRIARILAGAVWGIVLLSVAAPVWALSVEAEREIEFLKKRIEALERRLEQQEQLQQQQEQQVQLQQVQQEPQERESASLFDLGEVLSIHGLLEVEAFYTDSRGSDEESDLDLATMELEIGATINENLSGYILFLYEEPDDDSVRVDEALVTLGCPREFFQGRLSLTGGKMYVPFGRFESHFITDPLTLDLGETNNTALSVAWQRDDLVVAKVGVFGGETDTDGDNNNIDSFVASLEFQPLAGLILGGSYLSDLAESDIGLVHEDAALGNVYSSSVPGVGAFLTLEWGAFCFDAEYLAATRKFNRAVVEAAAAAEGELTGRRPRAWNLELAYAPLERWELAVRLERARNFQDDARRCGATVFYSLMEHLMLGLEYLHADGKGEDNDPSHTLTTQLAFEF